MVTITGDSLENYGISEFGGRCHDLLVSLGSVKLVAEEESLL